MAECSINSRSCIGSPYWIPNVRSWNELKGEPSRADFLLSPVSFSSQSKMAARLPQRKHSMFPRPQNTQANLHQVRHLWSSTFEPGLGRVILFDVAGHSRVLNLFPIASAVCFVSCFSTIYCSPSSIAGGNLERELCDQDRKPSSECCRLSIHTSPPTLVRHVKCVAGRIK